MRFAVIAASFALALAMNAPGQETKPQPPPDKASKAFTPPGWKVLNLSKEQSFKIGGIHAGFKGKIKDLEDKIAGLKAEEKQAFVAVLTADQKKQLSALIIPPEETKTPEKK